MSLAIFRSDGHLLIISRTLFSSLNLEINVQQVNLLLKKFCPASLLKDQRGFHTVASFCILS